MHAHSKRAVSPAIGVVLLIAITGVLASTVAVFALDLPSTLDDSGPWNEETPDAEFSAIQNGETLWITHDGGESIDASALSVRGAVVDSPVRWDTHGSVSEADRLTVDVTDVEGYVDIVWEGYAQDNVLRTVDLGA